jgi:hypothetical protein
MKITPKAENANVVFRYHVTMEDMLKQQQRTPEEIFAWLEVINAFLNTFKTEEDRERNRLLKNKKTWLTPEELESLKREIPHLFEKLELRG